MAETPAERAKARALRLLEKRDYSEAELSAKLMEKGDDPDSARAAAARMAELGFVNDENYAAMVVRHYAAKGCGRAPEGDELRRACAALIRRGFSWEEVSSAAKRLSHGLELDE